MLSKAEKTRQFILETAAPLFNEKGVSGVNIDDVLAATKLTKGCLYGHFESKEDLSLQVIDLLLSKNREKLITTIGKSNTAKGKMFAYLDFYKDPLNTHIKGGCPLFNIAVESDDNYPRIKEKIATVFRQGQDEFAAIIQQGIHDKEFSKRLDAPLYAFKLVAAIEGAIVMCRIMNTSKPMQGLIKSLKAEIEAFTL